MVMISRYASREADNAECSGGGVQCIPRAPVARIRGGEWVVGEMAFVHLTHHAADAMNARRKWPPRKRLYGGRPHRRRKGGKGGDF